MTTFGIDLGTANSCIAYIGESGRPVIINNTSGEPTTPSAVYFAGPDKVTVGQAAKDVAVLVPVGLASFQPLHERAGEHRRR